MNDDIVAETDNREIVEQIRVFGENLRGARLDAGLTQVELSRATPLDRAAISRLECGERAPDMPTLMRLCAALGTRPTDLVNGVGPKRRTNSGPPRLGCELGRAAQFGANLKWARSRTNISQERLALDAKVDRAAISVYENGGREPNLRTVLKLAWKLEMPPASLLAGIE